MDNKVVHEIEIIASSMDAIKDALDLSDEVSEGAETTLAHGATLTVTEVSKSSGFDATTVILTGLVTMALNTSGAILIEWLKSKLFAKKDTKHKLTIIVDGKKIEVADG
jgi:hypothetical protein